MQLRETPRRENSQVCHTYKHAAPSKWGRVRTTDGSHTEGMPKDSSREQPWTWITTNGIAV